jgi:hypothetical protein
MKALLGFAPLMVVLSPYIYMACQPEGSNGYEVFGYTPHIYGGFFGGGFLNLIYLYVFYSRAVEDCQRSGTMMQLFSRLGLGSSLLLLIAQVVILLFRFTR